MPTRNGPHLALAAQVAAAAISLSGFGVLVGVERGLRRSLHLLESELFLEPLFSVIVAAIAALGLFLVVYGVASGRSNSPQRIKLFLFAEAPLALFVGGFAAWYLNIFRLVGDTGPRKPVDLSHGVPFGLLLFVRPVLFYSLLVIGLAVAARLFLRRARPVV